LLGRLGKPPFQVVGCRRRRADLLGRCNLSLESRGALGDLGEPLLELSAHRVG
jgi:hypothetical protein